MGFGCTRRLVEQISLCAVERRDWRANIVRFTLIAIAARSFLIGSSVPKAAIPGQPRIRTASVACDDFPGLFCPNHAQRSNLCVGCSQDEDVLTATRYRILANASTCTRKSGSANCGTETVALFGEGGPKKRWRKSAYLSNSAGCVT